MILGRKRRVLIVGTAILLCALISIGQASSLRERYNPARHRSRDALASERAVEPSDSHRVQPSGMLSRRAIDRLVRECFGGLLRPDTHTLAPGFVVGDFDGDGTNDLFVPARLARTLDKKDKSKLPFNYQDVLDPAAPASVALDLRRGDLAQVETWPLFAIVHGMDKATKGRCSASRGKFLLLFPMDKGTTALELFQGEGLPFGTIGDRKEDQPPPRLKGNAVLLLDSHREGLAIYWDGARYRWYPFNQFRK